MKLLNKNNFKLTLKNQHFFEYIFIFYTILLVLNLELSEYISN